MPPDAIASTSAQIETSPSLNVPTQQIGEPHHDSLFEHMSWVYVFPLFAMWLLAGLNRSRNGYREPHKATVFSAHAFENLFPAQPRKNISVWQDGRYQYALCEKG